MVICLMQNMCLDMWFLAKTSNLLLLNLLFFALVTLRLYCVASVKLAGATCPWWTS